MSYDSLAEFLSQLQDHGELVRVSATVDPALELAAITDRVAKSSTGSGPALLFESVKNSSLPVVTNLLGSHRRLCLCLGTDSLDELSAELDRRLQSPSPGGWLDALKLVPDWGGLSRWLPKLVKTGAVQQVVRMGRDVNLWDLPIPRSWPGERDPVLTSGLMVAGEPGASRPFHCRAPLVVTSQNELAWYDGDPDQNALLQSVRESGQNLPVAISLGGDPLLTLATNFPGIKDPRLFAGLLRGASVELVRCRTNELEVTAAAEIVIEGYVDAANPRSSRSLSIARDNGRYLERELPLIQVTAITHRANPVLPAMIVAKPISEESWITLGTERLMLPWIRRLIPEVVDFHRPFSGAGRNLLFVSLRKTRPLQASRILHALWGMESLGQTKLIVIVNEDIDVKNEDQVWFAVGNHAAPDRDFLFSNGLARDDDYTTSTSIVASRVGIDATRKMGRESILDSPQSLEMPLEILARVQERWSEFGLDR